MAKLSAVSACIFALVILLGAASTAGADIFTYELNGNYAESNGDPSLVPNGGTLGPDTVTGLRQCYTFGVNTGLSLSDTGYPMHIR